MSDWMGSMYARRVAEANHADFPYLSRRIVSVLDRLAAPAETQIAWCEEKGYSPVELGEEYFDTTLSSLDYFRIKGLLSTEAEVALAAVRAELERTMEKPELFICRIITP